MSYLTNVRQLKRHHTSKNAVHVTRFVRCLMLNRHATMPNHRYPPQQDKWRLIYELQGKVRDLSEGRDFQPFLKTLGKDVTSKLSKPSFGGSRV